MSVRGERMGSHELVPERRQLRAEIGDLHRYSPRTTTRVAPEAKPACATMASSARSAPSLRPFLEASTFSIVRTPSPSERREKHQAISCPSADTVWNVAPALRLRAYARAHCRTARVACASERSHFSRSLTQFWWICHERFAGVSAID